MLALTLSLPYCSFSQARDETQQRSTLEGSVHTKKRVKITESGEDDRGRALVSVRVTIRGRWLKSRVIWKLRRRILEFQLYQMSYGRVLLTGVTVIFVTEFLA